MIEAAVTVRAPERLWRIGRGDTPLEVGRGGTGAATPRSGNRFDSATGSYDVLYFGTTLDACFGETLARLRPSTEVIAVVRDEWMTRGFMAVGAVPADWRTRRTAVAVELGADADLPFLDVEHPDTHTFLRRELALGLSALGYQDLDVGVLRGIDRRVTRLVSEWAYRQTDDSGEPRLAGIRYVSRLCSDWECWAVFDDVDLVPVETKPITLDMPELQRVARGFELQVF